MSAHWERVLARWVNAGLIAPDAADSIRRYEAGQHDAAGLRWPVILAISFGALLVGAGVLLFVAANWDELGPARRFALTVLLVAAFHVAAATTARRFPALATALHAVGTICLGAGIFLAGQIFNLQEHWPGGVLLWAIGAWVAWGLLRDWAQAGLVAVLTPAWLGGEWIEGTRGWTGSDRILFDGLLLLAITYLTSVTPGRESLARRTLTWIGGLALIPAVLAVAGGELWARPGTELVPVPYRVTGWLVAIGVPLLLAWWLRPAIWMNLIAAAWVVLLGTVGSRQGTAPELAAYALCALGAVGLIAWGLRELSRARINLGVGGFALTVLAFYFSTVMDKLGRSASLVGLGALFLLGGWLLERTRRQLVGRVKAAGV